MTLVTTDALNSAQSEIKSFEANEDYLTLNKVSSSIENFVSTSTDKLSGEAWDSVRAKMSIYTEVIATRSTYATNMPNAMEASRRQLAAYMEDYPKLDTNDKTSVEEQLHSAQRNIANADSAFAALKSKGNVDSAAESNYKKLRAGYEDTERKYKKLLEKLNGLSAADKAAASLCNASIETGADFANTVLSIHGRGAKFTRGVSEYGDPYSRYDYPNGGVKIITEITNEGGEYSEAFEDDGDGNWSKKYYDENGELYSTEHHSKDGTKIYWHIDPEDSSEVTITEYPNGDKEEKINYSNGRVKTTNYYVEDGSIEYVKYEEIDDPDGTSLHTGYKSNGDSMDYYYEGDNLLSTIAYTADDPHTHEEIIYENNNPVEKRIWHFTENSAYATYDKYVFDADGKPVYKGKETEFIG